MDIKTGSKQDERLFPPLPRGTMTAPQPRLRICIASYDFVGPVRNGGVGTAFTSLGEALARAGHSVTFFYLSGTFCENLTLNHWIAEYQKKGIRFVPMPTRPELKIAASFHMTKSYEAYQFLRGEQFDIIHFSEWRAPGYYSIAAKKQGRDFQNTTLCVHTHGPTLWSLLSNGEYLTQVGDMELDFMERQSVKLADLVVSPSHYLARWMREQNWELPEKTFVQQYVQPANARRKIHTADPAPKPVRELVFFGRIEVRKGLVLFCDALKRLVKETALNELKITFLGKLTRISEMDGMAYLQDRTQGWPWKWEVISNLDQIGALNYLQGEGRLAVIPSLVDNLPNTVLECLGGGVPFLASDIGGIPEMILPEDRANILFPLRASAVAEKILRAVREGVAPARFAVEPEATERGWLDWHNRLQPVAPSLLSLDSLLDTPPLVSVCMSHFNRPELLRQALDSLRAQDYPNFEVVLVDDASTKPEATAYVDSLEAEFTGRGWQLIRNPEEMFVGAARNVAARHARGEYLMFMDDDNIAKANEISVFVSVARKTSADTVSCCLDFFSTLAPPAPNQLPDQRFLFLGPAVAASALRNYLGDTNSLFRRELFLKLGGFHEERQVGHEDWELLGDAILKGYHHEVVPEALVWYRRLGDGTSASTLNFLQRGHMHNIRPYLDAVPPALRTLILFAQGQATCPQGATLNGEAAAQIAYLKLSQRWRGLFDAARELFANQQRQVAAKLLKSALTAASETDNAFIVLEALLAIGTEMHGHNDPEARNVLPLAVQLARTLKRPADANLAQSLLAMPSGKRKALSSAPTKQKEIKLIPAKNAEPVVSIIIPVFNQQELTRRCLVSLTATGAALPHEIIVVNNASTDRTAELLKTEADAGRIRVVTNAQNEGFARGCNLGARAARGSILLFLNNDTSVTAGWLETLVEAARNAGAGVAGAKLLYADGTIQHAGIQFIQGVPDHPHRHLPADLPAANQPRELDMVTGACLLTSADLFRQLGGFDEVYRNGVEDVDYCLRVRAAGFKVIYEPRSVLYHLEGQSAGRFNHVNANLKIFFDRWAKSFDHQKRFIAPATPKIMVSEKSALPPARPTTPSIKTADDSVVVAWEGSFLDLGSLSHVNRELTGCLEQSPAVQLCRVNADAASGNALPEYRKKLSPAVCAGVQVTVRHAWPPNWSKPKQGKLVVIQPWEFGSLPVSWVTQSVHVDEFWVPTEIVRKFYRESGIASAKVRVVPNGIDPDLFRLEAAPRALATKKKFRFLFVGGTIGRKGPDVLLKAYLKTFTAADDVCLVIKDFGGKSVYTGQTMEREIKAALARPNAPEILYLDTELPPEALPGLYAACDCLVHPYRGEGFGLPILEAMACGLPVIVTAGGAADDFATEGFAYRIPATRRTIGDTISGMKLTGPGWLLEPDAEELAARMKWVASHRQEARQLGQRASEYVRREWTWEKSAQIAAERLQELAAAAPKKPALESNRTKPVNPVIVPACGLVGQLDKAREALSSQKPKEAWELAGSALKSRPFHPEALLLAAEIAASTGDGQAAHHFADRARNLAPDWKPAHQFLNRPLKGSAGPAWLVTADLLKKGVARLTVCVITRNEERFLGQCLASVKAVADQLVVVDTGSTDKTTEIAESFGAEVYSFPWCDDFSAARNAALEHARGDWVLILDADEELPPDQHARLRADLQNSKAIALRLPLVNAGQENEGRTCVPRLFRNAPGVYFTGRIHEQVFPSLIALGKEWGLGTGIGTAQILHHGYTREAVKDRNKVERNLKLLRLAVEESPEDANLAMNLGLELVRSGELENGLVHYRRAFELVSTRAASETAPELREALLTQLTSQLYKVRAYDEIVQVLTSGTAKRGTGLTASLHFALGLAYFELGQPRESAEQMRQCVAKRRQQALSPINTDILTAAPYHCLAMSLARTGDVAGAEKAFQQGLNEKGREEEIRVEYAKFLSEQNRAIDGLHKLHELVSSNPKCLKAWRAGGQIALSRPDFLEVASDWTAEAQRQLPEDTTILAQRGEALLLNQQTGPALEVWQKLTTQDPQPRSQAAVLLCQLLNDDAGWGADLYEAEVGPVSRAFIDWYQRCLQMRTQAILDQVNQRLERLRSVLPAAVGMIESALDEARSESVAVAEPCLA